MSATGTGDGALAVLEPRVRAHLPRVKALMRDGLLRRSPHQDGSPNRRPPTLFPGSYDWHSNVLAHWSLLTMARADGDGATQRLVLERLDDPALAEERIRVARASRVVTFPYDLGWLSMLLGELARQRAAAASLRAFRAEVAERILSWLEWCPFADRTGVPSGAYRSYPLAFLLLRLSAVGQTLPGCGERLSRIERTRIAPQVAAMARYEARGSYDFLWLPAVMALNARLGAAGSGEGSAYRLPELRLPAAVPTIADCHRIGRELSALWPTAVDAAAGDTAARDALNERLTRILARRELWDGDYTTTSHWVPQYIWLVVWLALGRP